MMIWQFDQTGKPSLKPFESVRVRVRVRVRRAFPVPERTYKFVYVEIYRSGRT
jgi:hypothetical protein